jgi:YD repeat-containing protein
VKAQGPNRRDAVDVISPQQQPDLASVTDALNRTSYFFADALGRTVAVTDALGNRTTLQYDALDRVIRATDALGGSPPGEVRALRTTTMETS